MKSKLSFVLMAFALTIGAVILSYRLFSEDSSETEAGTDQTHEIVEAVVPSPVEPIFEGELAGIRFAGEEELAAEGALVTCSDSPEMAASSIIQGESEHLAAPAVLPPGGVMPAQTRGPFPAPNPGVVMCKSTGSPISAWRYYEFPKLANGDVPFISIEREFGGPVVNVPYRKGELEVLDLAGHPALRHGAAREIATGDVWETTYLIPAEDGLVTIRTHEVPLSEAVKVAEAVASTLPRVQTQ